MNTLRSMLKDYLATRRALGFKLHTDGTGLETFVSYVEAIGADHITNEIALTWARLPASVQSVQWSRRLGFVRGFARYCSAFDPRTQVPPTDPAAKISEQHRRAGSPCHQAENQTHDGLQDFSMCPHPPEWH